MSTTLSPLPVQKFFDNNGNALVNGQLFTYQAGTQTPAPTYTDSTGATQNTNPVILNARGEAQVWIPPNTAYKYVLADSLGNTIWTVDQIVNAQLLTLYGGVDSGIANAYVLSFASNLTGYIDGVIVYWIPSHANTGASTININGLGVINLTNQDGSALRPNQITPNQVSSLMIKGGAALLLSGSFATGVLAVPGGAASPSIAFSGDPATGFYFNAPGQIALSLSGAPAGTISTGLAAFTLNGVSGTVNFNARYYTNGLWAAVRFPQISGTSNSTAFSASTTNTAIVPPQNVIQWISMPAMEDNSASIYSQVGIVSAVGLPPVVTTTFAFYKNGNAVGWTASGTKGITDGNVSVNALTVAYMLI